MAARVTVYTVDGCNFCPELISFYRKKGISFKEVRLNQLKDSELSKVMPKISVGGAVTTPITIVNGEKLVGAGTKVKRRVLCKTVDRSACNG